VEGREGSSGRETDTCGGEVGSGEGGVLGGGEDGLQRLGGICQPVVTGQRGT
jgi:hypothetical protein